MNVFHLPLKTLHSASLLATLFFWPWGDYGHKAIIWLRTTGSILWYGECHLRIYIYSAVCIRSLYMWNDRRADDNVNDVYRSYNCRKITLPFCHGDFRCCSGRQKPDHLHIDDRYKRSWRKQMERKSRVSLNSSQHRKNVPSTLESTQNVRLQSVTHVYFPRDTTGCADILSEAVGKYHRRRFL